MKCSASATTKRRWSVGEQDCSGQARYDGSRRQLGFGTPVRRAAYGLHRLRSVASQIVLGLIERWHRRGRS